MSKENEPMIRMKVEEAVLSNLLMHGLDVNDVCAYFTEVYNKATSLPSNFRKRFAKKPKPNVWIIRDNYPGTHFMFKMTIVKQSQEDVYSWRSNEGWDLKLQDCEAVTWVAVKCLPQKRSHFYFNYDKAQKYLMEKAANDLIGDNMHKVEPFIPYKLKKPKRMFPKGYNDGKPSKRTRRKVD